MADVQLNLVVIRAEDIDRAAEFYRLLGLEFQKHRHGSGPEHYASEQGELVFEIYPRQKQSEGSAGTRLGFCVTSLDALIACLEDAGARIVSRPADSQWGRRAVISEFAKAHYPRALVLDDVITSLFLGRRTIRSQENARVVSKRGAVRRNAERRQGGAKR